MKSVLTPLIFLFALSLQAQESECLHLVADSAEVQLNENEIQEALQFPSKTNQEFTVTVVFHVIHKGEPYGQGTNISDEQLYSAIEDANEWFQESEISPWTGVQFCLAHTDPDGNPTNGINRVDGTDPANYTILSQGFTAESEAQKYNDCGINAGNANCASEYSIKHLSRWSNQHYHNVWIVSSINGNNGGSGIQGYAYFPTTVFVDGIVQLYNTIGTTGTLKSSANQNKTFVHELGHSIGALFHVFNNSTCASAETNCQIQGDHICDTPVQNIGYSCATGSCGFVSENHMDYLSQNCRIKWTQGQINRMRAVCTTGTRQNLVNNSQCATCAPTQPVALTQEWTDEGLLLTWQAESSLCRVQGEYIPTGKRRNYNVEGNSLLVPYDNLPSSGNYKWRVVCQCNGTNSPWSEWQHITYEAPISNGFYTGTGAIYDMVGQPAQQPLQPGIYIVSENGFNHKIAVQ